MYAVLNLYPYNPGHLLICPYRHVADYTDLSPAETSELATFTQHAMRVVRRVSGPDGFNLGMNQGSPAGAGIADHLHQHIVPRWSGDTNFMPIVGRTKVLPQLLSDTRSLLANAWDGPTQEATAEKATAEKATKKAASKKVTARPAASTTAVPAKAASIEALGTKGRRRAR